MASDKGGVGAGTVAFRRLLADAGGTEQARIDALVALVRHTVFAATAPGDGLLRTLTNASGESAAPLFTGPDVMQTAARGFGWVGADGAPACKELGAREALRQALAQGVQFVVLDLGTAYATEFARREVESVLATQKSAGVGAYAATGSASEIIRAAVRESTRPPGSMAAFVTPMPPAPKLPVEMDEPFRRASRGPTPRAHTTPADPVSTSVAPAIPAPRPPSAPLRPSVEAPVAQSVASLAPAAAAPPPSPPAESAARPASTAASAEPARESAEDAAPRESLRARRPAAATLFQVAAPGGSKRADSLPRVAFSSAPPPMPPDAEPELEPAPSTTATTAAMARVSPVPASPPAQPSSLPAPASPPPVPSKSTPNAPAVTTQKRSTTSIPRVDPDAGAAARKLAEKMMRTTGSFDDGRITRPRNPLAEKTLEHIAESLRRYPEVEWACELGDAQGRPVIGLRIDPAFANRAPEISDVCLAAATERKTSVEVLILTETSRVRDARALGVVFYPWRRK